MPHSLDQLHLSSLSLILSPSLLIKHSLLTSNNPLLHMLSLPLNLILMPTSQCNSNQCIRRLPSANHNISSQWGDQSPLISTSISGKVQEVCLTTQMHRCLERVC